MPRGARKRGESLVLSAPLPTKALRSLIHPEESSSEPQLGRGRGGGVQGSLLPPPMTRAFPPPPPAPLAILYKSLPGPSRLKPKEPSHLRCRGVSSRNLLYKWALWPSAPFPRARSPVIVRRSPLPDRGCSGAATKVYIIIRRTSNMAAIPSSGSLVATHDYYRRRLGSTSSNSSCGSAEYSGEVIPHHPGLPKSDPGHWWASFFFGKSSHPFMTTVLESPEHSGTFQVAHGTITCDLAQEAMRKRHVSEPSKTNTGPSA